MRVITPTTVAARRPASDSFDVTTVAGLCDVLQDRIFSYTHHPAFSYIPCEIVCRKYTTNVAKTATRLSIRGRSWCARCGEGIDGEDWSCCAHSAHLFCGSCKDQCICCEVEQR
jgi:hypothetical protein